MDGGDEPTHMIRSTLEERRLLQQQWAGGRDVWLAVPNTCNHHKNSSSSHDDTTVSSSTSFVRIVTRQRQVNEESISNLSATAWPNIVCKSILYGLSAYNPRGKIVQDHINTRQNELMKHEIMDALEKTFPNMGSWWDALGVWEDGGEEPGFIVAFLQSSFHTTMREWIMNLATKYEQGAIYEFRFSVVDEDATNEKKLIRSTIPVLTPDTEADVEVLIDQIQSL